MSTPASFSTLTSVSWTDTFEQKVQAEALYAVEKGELIYFPELPFQLQNNEEFFLTPNALANNVKNISLNLENKLKGTPFKSHDNQNLTSMMVRFRNLSTQFIKNLLPYYQHNLMIGRTSFRPAEIYGRKSSIRQDDTRLHVDAFPATPNQGKRILRVFSNVNPEERNRIWNLGEPFEKVVEYFAPVLRKPLIGSRCLLSCLKVTKSYRTLYDHYMLQLHDHMKMDDDYQKTVQKVEMHFPPGSTWVVMTDAVSHAALAGQYMLEQTFYLEPEAMFHPELSPLKVLERHFGRKLI